MTTSNSSPSPVPCLTFEQLSGGQREVLVEHDGQIYRLRLTKNNKLILNK
ncbi:MAG: hemin uptake protein HemP [Planctomycetaceae bacterium]|nr:hemin uptake protein HemP [Planctomycetaceae bacterium]